MSRVLLVDDEPNILAGYKRHLRKSFDIFTAGNGSEGLEVIKQSGPFSVVVSDLNMPGMNGLEFLQKVGEGSKNTSSIMLTGQAELQNAIEAVNSGRVFRFLTKPCSPEALQKAILDGLKQTALLNAERELLEKTFSGSIKLITDILSMAHPTAFGRASRIARWVKGMRMELGIRMWEVDVAAMLSQIGCITITDEVLEKVYSGQNLTGADRETYMRHPQVAGQILSNIPRLGAVAEIIRTHILPIANIKSIENKKVRAGALLLSAAVDFDSFYMEQSEQPAFAIAKFIQREKTDPTHESKIIAALERSLELEGALDIVQLPVNQLKPGMIFAEDVLSKKGRLLIAKGNQLTDSLLMRLENMLKHMEIENPVTVMLGRSQT